MNKSESHGTVPGQRTELSADRDSQRDKMKLEWRSVLSFCPGSNPHAKPARGLFWPVGFQSRTRRSMK